MKISLLTIWRVKNYGAELQAYATIKALQDLGHEVEIVDFRLGDLDRSVVKRMERVVFYLCRGNYKLLRFWNRYFPASRRYRSVDELRKNPPKADVYVVGSDQVWNDDITKEAAGLFFLDFLEEGVRKVSYASSFGNSQVSEKIERLVSERLSEFSAVSCRELLGVEYLRDCYGIDAMNVIDPTLLIDDYSELTGVIEEKRVLAYYPLSEYPELETFSRTLGDEMGLEHRVVNWKKYVCGVVWDRASVEEWVKTIAESSIVVTQSFHGMVFSLLYKRQFIVVVQDERRAGRVLGLLEQLGLLDRCFMSVEDAKASRVWGKEIDYSVVDDKLGRLREDSFKFLREALQ